MQIDSDTSTMLGMMIWILCAVSVFMPDNIRNSDAYLALVVSGLVLSSYLLIKGDQD